MSNPADHELGAKLRAEIELTQEHFRQFSDTVDLQTTPQNRVRELIKALEDFRGAIDIDRPSACW
jgi:hypothetical protein